MVAAFLTHCDAYCMSDFNEEKLLSAIDRVKVIEQKQMCYNFFILLICKLASIRSYFPRKCCLDLPPS